MRSQLLGVVLTVPPPIEFERLLAGLKTRPDLLADISAFLKRRKQAQRWIFRLRSHVSIYT